MELKAGAEQAEGPADRLQRGRAARPPAATETLGLPEAAAVEDDRRYIHIRRSHFYAALLPLMFAAGLAYGYLLWGRASPRLEGASSDAAGFSIAGRIEVDPADDPSIGPPDAPIIIVEFADFNCPF